MKNSQKSKIYNELETICNEIKESYKWLDIIDSYSWSLDSEIEHLNTINDKIINAIDNIFNIVNCSK